MNIRSWFVAAILLVAIPALPAQSRPDALPIPVAANLPGLTVAQSLRVDGPDARRALGFPAAAPTVLREAENGNALAMAVISTAYATGSGVPQSDSEARRWASDAALSDLPFAHYVLAKEYDLSNPADFANAEQQYWLASDRGHIPAKRELALFLFRHQDVYRNSYSPRRDDDPRRLLDEAAAAGDGRATALRDALALNTEFTQLVRGGMPLMFQRGVSYVHESRIVFPCVTDLFTTNNHGVYRIDWNKSTTEMRSVTDVAVKGAVFTLWDGQGYVGLQLLMLENNDTYSPEQTRSMFRRILDTGQALGEICAGL